MMSPCKCHPQGTQFLSCRVLSSWRQVVPAAPRMTQDGRTWVCRTGILATYKEHRGLPLLQDMTVNMGAQCHWAQACWHSDLYAHTHKLSSLLSASHPSLSTLSLHPCVMLRIQVSLLQMSVTSFGWHTANVRKGSQGWACSPAVQRPPGKHTRS